MDLRKCEIQAKRSSNTNRGNEKKTEKEICYFHKRYDGVNKSSNLSEQFAFVESLENGTISNISIESYNIRFLSHDENSKYEMNKSMEKFKGFHF